MTEKESKTDLANRECLTMIREYVASTKEQETYSYKAIMGEYLDCYNVGMDMFNLGHTHATSSLIETIKNRLPELEENKKSAERCFMPESVAAFKFAIEELNNLLTFIKS